MPLAGHDPPDVRPQRLVVANRHPPRELCGRLDRREPVLAAEDRIGVVPEQAAQNSSLGFLRSSGRALEGAVMQPLLGAERVAEQSHVIPPW